MVVIALVADLSVGGLLASVAVLLEFGIFGVIFLFGDEISTEQPNRCMLRFLPIPKTVVENQLGKHYCSCGNEIIAEGRSKS